MREIKFRVYDKDSNKIYSQDDFILTFDTVGEDVYLSKNDKIIPLYRYDLMQYTGIKDKNGKEIYEGDIVKACNTFSDDVFLIGEVKYSEFTYSHCDEYYCKRYGYYIDTKWEDYQSNTGYPIQDSNILEVIGNIYEK